MLSKTVVIRSEKMYVFPDIPTSVPVFLGIFSKRCGS